MGRLKAHRLGLGFADQLGIQLGLRLSRLARAAGWLGAKNGSA
jgi:hypothetical protein